MGKEKPLRAICVVGGTTKEVSMERVLKLTCLFSALLLFSVVTCVSAGDVPRISIEALKKLQDENASVVVVDDRIKDDYDSGHIKGAFCIPAQERLSAADVAILPKDKLIVTYCNCGPGEADSENVANQLLDMGFKDVKVLADPSIVGWAKAGYPLER